MKNRILASKRFQWSAIGLAGAMLFGCGGGLDGTATSPTETASMVEMNETATVLSVKTQMPLGRQGQEQRDAVSALHVCRQG